MTLPDATDVTLLVTAIAWWLVARRAPHLRPVARVLALGLVTDAAQRALALAYHRSPHVHYTGADRVLFHAAQAAHLAWPVAVVALCAWALARLRTWVLLPQWGVYVAVAVLAYPHHDPDAWSPVYGLAQGGAVGACGVLVLGWLRRREWPGALQLAALALAAGEACVLVSPYLAGDVWSWALPSRVVVRMALCVVAYRAWRRS